MRVLAASSWPHDSLPLVLILLVVIVNCNYWQQHILWFLLHYHPPSSIHQSLYSYINSCMCTCTHSELIPSCENSPKKPIIYTILYSKLYIASLMPCTDNTNMPCLSHNYIAAGYCQSFVSMFIVHTCLHAYIQAIGSYLYMDSNQNWCSYSYIVTYGQLHTSLLAS